MATLIIPPVLTSPRDDAAQLYKAFKGNSVISHYWILFLFFDFYYFVLLCSIILQRFNLTFLLFFLSWWFQTCEITLNMLLIFFFKLKAFLVKIFHLYKYLFFYEKGLFKRVDVFGQVFSKMNTIFLTSRLVVDVTKILFENFDQIHTFQNCFSKRTHFKISKF